jgi:dTDP-4-amino-4,6-dideoxygalactose transaminase
MKPVIKIWRSDLEEQAKAHIDEYLEATKKVLLSGRYILAENLTAFENNFAEYCGTKYAVGVASGTEAIYLALAALDITSGDEVITTPFTAIPTFSAILMTGAKAVFVDIDPKTFTIHPDQIASKISSRTKAIMPVHLFGQMAEMEKIMTIAKAHDLKIIEDAAQAHGSLYRGQMAGHFGAMACYSFYPTKNLGAFGDAGAIVTDDAGYYERIKLLRNYGQESLYRTVINGVNSRLDELQAAYLSIKLKYLQEWNLKRAALAKLYREYLPNGPIIPPTELPHTVQNYHVYTVRARHRDRLQIYLEKEHGIQTNVYYPVPLHLQKSNQFLGHKKGDFPEAERACEEVLALPMYPEMKPEIVRVVCEAVKAFYEDTTA